MPVLITNLHKTRLSKIWWQNKSASVDVEFCHLYDSEHLHFKWRREWQTPAVGGTDEHADVMTFIWYCFSSYYSGCHIHSISTTDGTDAQPQCPHQPEHLCGYSVSNQTHNQTHKQKNPPDKPNKMKLQTMSLDWFVAFLVFLTTLCFDIVRGSLLVRGSSSSNHEEDQRKKTSPSSMTHSWHFWVFLVWWLIFFPLTTLHLKLGQIGKWISSFTTSASFGEKRVVFFKAQKCGKGFKFREV